MAPDLNPPLVLCSSIELVEFKFQFQDEQGGCPQGAGVCVASSLLHHRSILSCFLAATFFSPGQAEAALLVFAASVAVLPCFLFLEIPPSILLLSVTFSFLVPDSYAASQHPL